MGLGPYRHLGTWIDMYNAKPWNNPERVVEKMANNGVTTLFLQTSNYKKKTAIYRPTMTGRFIEAAHARGIKVVSWYLPSFTNHKRDLKRSMAAIRFESPQGQRFDSFSLDIEATKEPDIATRNRRALRLSAAIRGRVGDGYVMAAIVPDVYTRYWPSFPYAGLAKHFQVFMPMGYFSYRVSSREGVKAYTTANIRAIRDRTGNPNISIHPIGGIAGEVGYLAARGYVESVKENRVLGGSYYDFPITTNREWTELKALAKDRTR
jgi:hypothetical protein